MHHGALYAAGRTCQFGITRVRYLCATDCSVHHATEPPAYHNCYVMHHHSTSNVITMYCFAVTCYICVTTVLLLQRFWSVSMWTMLRLRRTDTIEC
jgi:hypothetical protein